MRNSAWQYVLGENYCTKVTDGTHDTPKQVASGKYLVTSKHIKGDEIDFDDAYFISDEDFHEINKRSKVDQWDIIISMIGAYCGFCFIERNSNINYAVKNVGLFKAGTELNAKWLYYYLNSSIGKANLDAAKGGSSQPYIALGALRKLPILTPVDDFLKEKIVGVLDCIDEKIRTNNRINAELEAMAKTLYDYWFVQFDFPDANGKPYKSSGGKMAYTPPLKCEIPAGWLAATLASITPISNESLNPADFPDKEFRLFSIPVFDATKAYGLELGQSIGSNKFTVLGTDLLVSKLNPWFSRVVYAMSEVDQICSTEFVVWRSPNEELKNYLYLIATSQQFIAHCVQSATGTSNSHKRVNPDVMMRFDLPYQKEIAEKFGEKVAPFIKKKIANQYEIKELTQLRDWLLPMLMNGQVSVA